MSESPRPRIFIDVDDGITAGTVKIKWRRERPWGMAYSIPRGMLEEYSVKARNRLEALVVEAMKGNLKSTGGILKELAQQGRRLYVALFHDPEGVGKATNVRNRLSEMTDPSQILVTMGTPVHVPWGLIYDGDPNQLSGDATDIDFAHYQNFWCIKYRVASVYQAVDPPGVDQPLPGDVLRVHAVMNRAVYQRAEPQLTVCGTHYWDWITNRFGPLVFSQVEWLDRWAQECNRVAILYFYGHADGSNIGLGTDNISANDLAQSIMGQTGAALPCLVFLNGCSTAIGDPKGGFLEATAGSRFCGFIGAEASIPEVYGLRFGSAFLYELQRGEKTLIEIMAMLRERHWPLSLLYNVYCVPDLRVNPVSPPPPPVVTGNFCDLDLGSQGI
jgi:hypothetical protein